MSTKNPTPPEINAALDAYREFRNGRPVESGRMAIVKNILAAAFWQSAQPPAAQGEVELPTGPPTYPAWMCEVRDLIAQKKFEAIGHCNYDAGCHWRDVGDKFREFCQSSQLHPAQPTRELELEAEVERQADEKIDVCKHGAPTRPGVSICAVCRIDELELELQSLRQQLSAYIDDLAIDAHEEISAAERDVINGVIDELGAILKGTTW